METTANTRLANNEFTTIASSVLSAIGGKENVTNVDYCATRLRFEVKDSGVVDDKGCQGRWRRRRHQAWQDRRPGRHRTESPVCVR